MLSMANKIEYRMFINKIAITTVDADLIWPEKTRARFNTAERKRKAENPRYRARELYIELTAWDLGDLCN